MTAGEFTLSEILSQPEAWRDGLMVARGAARDFTRLLSEGDFEQVLFTGCGSTYYLSIAAAAALTRLTGLNARALPGSEVWFHPDFAYLDHATARPRGLRTLLVAVSRSGETSETINACADFLRGGRGGRGELVTLTCYPGCTLSEMGALNLVFPSGMEQSVAQTRSFSTLFLGALVLAASASGRAGLDEQFDRLPAALTGLLEGHAALATALAEDPAFKRFYFLGSGARYGLACELSLKMKEMSLSHSEPFHFLEFRHGPKSMVTPGTLITALRSERDRAQESAVIAEMEAMGARVLVIDETGSEIAFRSGVEETLRGPLYLPAGQMLACRHSLAKGLNPDRPANLESVVRL